jgi:tRNA(Arg) A34 adenosine deaminase TadA
MLSLAEDNVRDGRFPYVALLELEGEVIAKAVNIIPLPSSKGDFPIFEPPEAHPELKLASDAVRLAKEKFPKDRERQVQFLKSLTVYANCEPCNMCTQALAGALIHKIIFSISHADASKTSGIEVPPIASTMSVFKNYGITCELIGPIETERALKPFKEAWLKVQAVLKNS